MSFHFRPAIEFTDRHGVFVALTGGTNSGKTFSALRLARGIAGAGNFTVLDTEGGRTLHLKKEFAFDANLMGPPFRPARFAEAAQAAEEAGYDVLLIDSFSMEWVGLGGVLDWQEAELERMAGKDHAKRERVKGAAWIAPKMAHKAMVYSFLQRRMPIIFSIRGEETFIPPSTKVFKSICNKAFPFEITVSFRLASEKRGIIDLSDPASFKMEAAHRAIFKDGEQLSEAHGERLAAWARGGTVGAVAQPGRALERAGSEGPAGPEVAGSNPASPPPRFRWIMGNGTEAEFPSVDIMAADLRKRLERVTADQARAARERNAAILAELSAAGFGDQMLAIDRALAARIGEPAA